MNLLHLAHQASWPSPTTITLRGSVVEQQQEIKLRILVEVDWFEKFARKEVVSQPEFKYMEKGTRPYTHPEYKIRQRHERITSSITSTVLDWYCNIYHGPKNEEVSQPQD